MNTSMEDQSKKLALFELKLKSARLEEMTNMLRCKLCGGLLRFAHTLVECGHTFCQQCIFAYIKTFKGRNPQIKCPQCHAYVQPIYHRSVIRDVYKQSIVDLLEPSFAAREKLIIERIRCLFPDFNLSFLLDEFSFNDSARRKRSQKAKIMSSLSIAVKEKLGMSFDAFSEQISDQKSFQKLKEKVGFPVVEQRRQSLLLNIRPRRERDLRFVGVNNKIQVNQLIAGKIRKFLEKKLLLRLQANEQLARQLIGQQSNHIEFRIELFLGERILQQNQQVDLIPEVTELPIYYTLSF